MDQDRQDHPTRPFDRGTRDGDTQHTDEIDLGSTRDAQTVAFPAASTTDDRTSRFDTGDAQTVAMPAAERDRETTTSPYDSGDAQTEVFRPVTVDTGRTEHRATTSTADEPTVAQPRARERRAAVPADDIVFTPSNQHRAPVGATPLSPGPHGGMRFLAAVLALVLAAGGLVAFAVVVLVAVAQAGTSIVGADAPPVWLLPVAALAAGILFFLAGVTSRMSGAGVTVSGVLLVVLGILALSAPALVTGWLGDGAFVEQIVPVDGIGSVIDLAFEPMAGLLVAVVGSLSLVLGLLFLAIGIGVHGARHAGWRRGTGG